MKKTGTSKSKKAGPVKEEQKITSFFNKLVIQKTSKFSSSNNKPDEQACSSSDFKSKNENCITLVAKINGKRNAAINVISPCKNTRIPKKKTPVKGHVKALKFSVKENIDNSDSDFELDRKEKVKSNLLVSKSENGVISDINTNKNKEAKVALNGKVLDGAVKQNKNNKSKENSLSPPNPKSKISTLSIKNSQLIVDFQVKKESTKDIQETELFSATPEKTYLQRDEILLDITLSTECAETLKSETTELQNYSSPHENLKKRKFQIESPDVIPPTPQELPEKVYKPKSKLCIENKFSKIIEEPSENINALESSPPNKKICAMENEINCFKNPSDKTATNELNQFDPNTTLIVKSTTNFIVSPVKCISPSKRSPQKGIKLKCPVSPSKSNSKLKRSLFDSNSHLQKYCEPINQNTKENKTAKATEEMNDMFDDDWDIEINQIEEKINQLNLENWQYCKILEVSRNNFQNLIIKVQSIENNEESVCILQGVWQDLNLQSDDIVNIFAVKNSGDIPYHVNNNEGFIIYDPDFLISPTSIVGSLFCKRRGILAEKFRGVDSENKVMIVGTLVHKLLQDVLRKEISKADLIEKKLMEILSTKSMISTSYSSQIPIEDIKKELVPFIPKIVNFVEKYMRNDKNKVQYFPKDQSEDWKGKIQSIQDIEENIWCPQLGMKGKIDVTVKTNNFGSIIPLELKTGRTSMSLEHRGQVLIYTMIMNELGYNVTSGLLLYLREEALREVLGSHREKRDLIMLRNDFAYYIKQRPIVPSSTQNSEEKTENTDTSAKTVTAEVDSLKQLKFAELPEPINHHSACGKCPYANICTALLSRDNTFTLSENHPLKKISLECLEQLEQNHIDYFIHWTSLLTIENNYKPPLKELKDIWRLLPYKRENRGKSLCYLKITSRVTEQNDSFIHILTRSTEEKIMKLIVEKELNNDFTASGLLVGNYVVISSETRCAIATGFIKDISDNSVTVSLERNLSERYINKIFHLDTYESQTIVNFSTSSVAALLEPTERAKRLRELIIDRQPSVILGDLSKTVVAKGASILRKLNKIQQRAVLKALTTKDYLLIKGMPGTGKTATIVALIELLVKLNKTVLVTSHTHSAVDNVCLRLLKNGVDVLRLGSESRVHQQLKHRTESVLTAHCTTVQEMKQVYDSASVVAVTCLGAAHPMLRQRKLDICIVDESTQVLQCSVFQALLSTNSFILIGDPDQLPPVVKNPEAVRRGMNESLFERLDNLDSTITLTLQYRMNKIITDLANSVTYKGELFCADDTIGCAVLNIPNQENLEILYNQEQWILKTIDTKLENSVVAIDTGPTWNISSEQKSVEDNLLSELQVAPQNIQEDEERRCSNNYEAGIVISIVQALKEAGISSNSIGVIAPYRAQVHTLKKLVSKMYENENCEPVEVNTVDQYQGRDKEVIIYSCTRSRNVFKTKNNSGFEILEDKRRLTVAITRAKHKLIIIGDFETLKDYSPFKKLLDSLSIHQKLILKDESNNFNWNKIVNRLEC